MGVVVGITGIALFIVPELLSEVQYVLSVRRQNLLDLGLPELREALGHQVVLMLITVMHLLAERQGL